jgi:hypothetical protein
MADLVMVEWWDILQDSSYSTHESVACPVVKTVGWLASKDKKFLKVGNVLSDNGDISGITAMPVGCVISCRTIED